MRSLKKSVVAVLTGLTASATFTTASWAATVSVNRESQTVQTPATSGESGISYVQSGSGASTLKVYTDGFLFCANPGDGFSSPATLAIAHEDKSFSPAHPWLFLTATDVDTASYSAGSLGINTASATSLTCLGTADDGAVATDARSGIFDNGYDRVTEVNYNHIVNWLPPQGFDWTDPDWAQVPADPCTVDGNHPARLIENVACVGVTGVRPAPAGGNAVRAGTIWTATDGFAFTYLLRFDARLGPQQVGGSPEMQLPPPKAVEQGDGAAGAQIVITDAFDSTFLGTSPGDGQYCFLTEFPQVLNSSVCSGQQTYPLDGKPMNQTVALGFPPVGIDTYSFYVAVSRPVVGGHPSLTTPVVAAAALMEYSAVEEGGDEFRGDDVVFGFMPTSNGFPWMSGQ